MAYCNSLVGIPKDCGDNNSGSLEEVLIGSFEDVLELTVTSTGDPDTDGEVTAVTREVGTQFEQFTFPKDTSIFSEELVVDLVADSNGFSQTIEMGFRRIDLRKRNAIALLVQGRRDLVAAVKDTNGDHWLLGTDQGLRVSANSKTSNGTRAAGQALPVTLTSEYEKYQMYKMTKVAYDSLLVVVPAPLP
jgi:hypothetical protein